MRAKTQLRDFVRVTAFKVNIITVVICSIILVTHHTNSHAAVRAWDIFEVRLISAKTYLNPYIEGLPDRGKPLVSVVFTGTSGDAIGHTYNIAGFWDGGREWKVRFAPPYSGTWTYLSVSDDPGLNGTKGTLECLKTTENEKRDNPVLHGLVQVCKSNPRPGRYFEYTDGTPFLWIADTWWGWAKDDIKLSTFKSLVDDRVDKGFTLGQLYVPGNSNMARSLIGKTFDQPEIERLRHIDDMIEYANSRGMTVWVEGWWASKDLKETAGEENVRRWWRYLVHRFGAYNVIWTLCGEYTLYDFSGFGLQFWKDVGNMVAAEDPYERIVSVHPNPSIYQFPDDTKTPYYSTAPLLHNESWLDYNQSQVGHSKWRNEMIPEVVRKCYTLTPNKPIVVTECWYEFLEGDPNGDIIHQIHTTIADEIIFGGWSAILSGAAGHSYGGGHIWRAHVPESPVKRAGTWPMEMSLDSTTFDYPGAQAIGHMAKFLKGIEWWKLEPHPELVSVYPQPFCSADPGKEYVVYMRYGGGLKLDMSPATPDEPFEYSWLDPRTGETLEGACITPGKEHMFVAPGTLPTNPYMWQPIGWVLHVKKK